MRDEVYALASRIGVSPTLPERECDIDAQLAALADPEHPKRAVFLARGNELGSRKLPRHLFVERRREGTLITDSSNMALHFRQLDHVTDSDLAGMLCYPETKADVIEAGGGYVVQARTKDDCVVYEAACSSNYLGATLDVARRQVPKGGVVDVVSIQEALARRIGGLN